MTPDDAIATPILPDPAVTGSHRVTAPVPAGAAPEDVRHWFDLETILELQTPPTRFDQAAEAAAQYRRASRSENTRRAYPRRGGWEFRALPPGRRPLNHPSTYRDGSSR
jgi:hypothetical protein